MGLLSLSDSLPASATKAIDKSKIGTNDYSPIPNNWYKSLPYAFVATDSSGEKRIFNLPLNPSNINVSTFFATNVIATIGGTIEEHAPQRYFDISISGTTGIAPTNVSDKAFSSAKLDSLKPTDSVGRQSYVPAFSFGQHTGGFFAKTTGALDNALNVAKDIFLGAKVQEAGFTAENSGYMAFHNFYKFLLKSKKELAGGSSSAIGNAAVSKLEPLRFISYKDNQQYTCSISRFELTRSAENPMLYNYSIQLRAYELKTVGSSSVASEDRLHSLGLGSDSSLLSKIKNTASSAKRGLSAIGGLRRIGGG